MRRAFFVATVLPLLIPILAHADTIVLNTAGSSVAPAGFYGQSVMTPSGGPWRDIAFAFLGNGATSQAAGTLFLLSTQYLGTPGSLSNSTPGFIARSLFVGEGTGAWMFDPSVTLLPSTQYFLYSNFNFPTPGGGFLGGVDSVPGTAYFSSGGNFALLSVDENFRLIGLAVPEPSTWATCALGLLVLTVTGLRRRTIVQNRRNC